jgi:hypothetical protein
MAATNEETFIEIAERYFNYPAELLRQSGFKPSHSVGLLIG